jgi:hypothetical protein
MPTGLVVLFTLALIAPQKALAQSSHLKQIEASAYKEKIVLSWTTPAGFSCQDVHIELGTDSANLKRVGTIFGICGDTTEQHYSFIIDVPFLNQTNYLRVELGGVGFSQTISVLVIAAKKSVIIVPHPANSSTQFYFDNPFRKRVEINFYTTKGELLARTNTSLQVIDLVDLNLPNGQFIYEVIREEETPIRGLIVVSNL